MLNCHPKKNATCDEIVTHLELEFEVNGLAEGDDFPVRTISLAPPAARPGNGLRSCGTHPGFTCNYCKEPGRSKDDCTKLDQKEENKRKINVGNVQEATSKPRNLR